MVLSARFYGHIKPGGWDTIHYDCEGRGCEGCDRGWQRNDGAPLVKAGLSVLFQSYAWFKNYRQMPFSGAWTDQAVYWVRAVEWCEAVDMMYRQKIADQNQENAAFVAKAKRYL